MNWLEQKHPEVAGALWWFIAKLVARWYNVPRVHPITSRDDAYNASAWAASWHAYGRVLLVRHMRFIGIGTLTVRWHGVYIVTGDVEELLTEFKNGALR